MTELASLTPEEQNNLFRARRTVLQMLKDRGYEIEDVDLDADFETFAMTCFTLAAMNGVYDHKGDGPRIRTKFDTPVSHRIGKKEVLEWLEEADRSGVRRVILILREDNVTSGVRSSLERMRDRIHVELFHIKEVMINITEHELVPKHEVLNEQEKADLLERYKVEPSQLPRIHKTDPVVRYLGVGEGTILKITRKSETAGKYVTYRVVG